MAHNTIFSWPLLQTLKASIIIKKNNLVSGLLGEQLNMEMMVNQISREAPKTPEGIPVQSPATVLK